MAELEIGRAKRAERAYALDDVGIVPSRRTRDTNDVATSWQIDAYGFGAPLLAAPMDSVVSPATALQMARLGILPVLDVEGVWGRYDDADAVLAEIADLPSDAATRRMQEIYSAPVQPELVARRIAELRAAGITVAAAISPPGVLDLHEAVISAGVDILVIRGTTVSAEHVAESTSREPLNLKELIYTLDVPVIVGGCATYQAALHLMRTGAAGVLCGFGGGAGGTTRSVLGITVPMASALADVAAARRDYLDESGGRYVHVIADGSIATSGDLTKAIACGADAAMVGSPLARASEAPGRGWHWGSEVRHPELPRGERVRVGGVGTFEEIVVGPSHAGDGSMNLVGALRRTMATCGYTDVKDFQRVRLTVRD
jgi:IMP dehydrogenase